MYTHFNLGFGYKYQYLLGLLIYSILSKKILINNPITKVKFTKILNNYNKNKTQPIRANVSYFFNQINTIMPSNDFKYNQNCLLMLEGEPSFFEDLNIFFNLSPVSNITFLQVKGSMATDSVGSLDSAIISTIGKLIFNKNFKSTDNFFILINKTSSSYLLLESDDDKRQAYIKILRQIKFLTITKEKGSKANRNKFYKLMDNYLEEEFKNNNSNVKEYIKLKNPTIYRYFKTDIENKPLFVILKRLEKILDSVKIIENIDHRLICLLLFETYGKNKFFELLWNIEMKSMDSSILKLNLLQNQLRNIGFTKEYLLKIRFSKDNYKSSIGKIF